MVQLTAQQRIFIVQLKMQGLSKAEISQRFLQQFNRRPPCKKTLNRNVNKYLQWGTSLNRNKMNSGRLRTVVIPDNIENVRRIVQTFPTNTSSRRNGSGLSQSAFNRITRKELNVYPYRIKRRHELKPADYARRERFCRWFTGECMDPTFLSRLVIGDEASFAMNGNINSKNMVYYSPKGEQPDHYYDKPESREKITVWVGLCGDGHLIGPYFYDGNVDGNSCNTSIGITLLVRFQSAMVGSRWSACSQKRNCE